MRKNGDTDPLKQYVWGRRYVHSPVVRWRDANTDGDYDDAADDTLYYCNDANFNVTALVAESSGSVVERYTYDPYGKVTVLDADFSADADGLSDVDNVVLYTGHKYDAETGLYWACRRYYHPTLGRWSSRDPYAEKERLLTLYVYVSSSPCAGLDPEGLFNWELFGEGAKDFFWGAAELVGVGLAETFTGGGATPVVTFVAIDGGVRTGKGAGEMIGACFADEASAEKVMNAPDSITNVPAVIVREVSGSKEAAEATDAAVSLASPGVGKAKSVKYLTKTLTWIIRGKKAYDMYELTESTVRVGYELAQGDDTEEDDKEGKRRGRVTYHRVRASGRVVLRLRCPKEKGTRFGWYEVQSGDNLWALWRARKNHSISWADMKKANGMLKNIDRIWPGHYVCVDYCISDERTQARGAR